MTARRLFLACAVMTLLAACTDEVAQGEADASGEVLEGTISDEMLPLDRVQSEPPLEDPEAFAEAQSKAVEGAPVTAVTGAAEPAAEDPSAEEPAAEPEPAAED